MTKTAILNEIATNTNLSRGQVNSVMDELESVIERHIRKRSVGEFTLPGLLKIKAAKRPATKNAWAATLPQVRKSLSLLSQRLPAFA